MSPTFGQVLPRLLEAAQHPRKLAEGVGGALLLSLAYILCLAACVAAFGMPTLLAWAYNDPTATIEQGHALFDLIARGTPDSRMYIFNRAGHFSYREHPVEFNEMLRGFIERIV